MDESHKANLYMVRHTGHDGEDESCCSLEMCSEDESSAFSNQLKIHHDPEKGWTSLALIEGLVNHLRWTQQQGGGSSETVEQAIKHLERAWTALAADHPQEKEGIS